MELRQLRYFVRIADLRSFSKASRSLHIVQPALSQQIASLEAEVGQPLLARMPSGVELTEHGEVFYAHAQRVLRQLDDMKDALARSGKETQGTVRVGLPQSMALRFAMPLIAAMQRDHPGVQLEFFDEISPRLVQGLRRGQLDIAVILDDEDAALLQSLPVLDESLLLVSRHDLTPAGEFVQLKALPAFPLALPGKGVGVRPIVEAALKRAGLALPRPAVVANSIGIMVRAIRDGLAHGVMTWSGVAEQIASGELVQKPIAPALTRRVHISTSPDFPVTEAARIVQREILALTRAEVASGVWQSAVLLEAT